MSESILKNFNTLHYGGVWFEFEGDRMKFRKQVEAFIRAQFIDPSGFLKVDESGPHWEGTPLHLSYAHTENVAILVYSRTHAVGVDVEALGRIFKTSIDSLAKRFFHPNEFQLIEQIEDLQLQRNEFLKLWVKKEAYAKLTRLGLSGSVSEELGLKKGIQFETVPATPLDFLAWVAIKPLI